MYMPYDKLYTQMCVYCVWVLTDGGIHGKVNENVICADVDDGYVVVILNDWSKGDQEGH